MKISIPSIIPDRDNIEKTGIYLGGIRIRRNVYGIIVIYICEVLLHKLARMSPARLEFIERPG